MDGRPEATVAASCSTVAGLGHEREWVRFWALVEKGEEP